MEARLPWLSYRAIEFIQSRIRPDHRVFEFGGGGSTLYFLDKGASVVTVEHDSRWFDTLRSDIAGQQASRWTGMSRPARQGNLFSRPDAGVPDHYHSSDVHFFGLNFLEYAAAIDAYPDDHFNWILVDGRARPSCMMHAVPKLKAGGFLVLDNFERAGYHPAANTLTRDRFRLMLDRQGPCPFTPDFTRTAIWQKNHA